MAKRHTQNNLPEQEQSFFSFSEAANDGILINESGVHVYANQGIAQLLGYTRDELIGTTIQDVVHPDEAAQILQRFQNRLQGISEPIQYETIFANKQGDKIPVDLTVMMTRWQGRQAVLAIVRDITERKLIEQTLRDSEKRYRSLVENSPDAIVVIDAETNQFIEVNEQAIKLFKQDKTTLFNSSINTLGPTLQPDGDNSNNKWNTFISQSIHGKPQTFEWTFQSSDQHGIPCEVRLSRMPFPSRKLIRGSIVDISHRKQIESALALSEQRLTSFFQAAFDVLLFHDDGIIQDVNNNITRLTGYSRDDVIGKHVLEFIAPESHQQTMQNMSSGYDAPYEIEVIHKDGTIFPAIIKAKTIDLDNQQQRVVSITDNSAHKNMQNELIQSGKELHTILDNMIDTFYRTNAKGEITMVSPSVYSLFGYRPEEVFGKKLSDYYVEEDGRDKFIAALTKNNGRVSAYEAPMRRKDGQIIWVATNAFVKTDAAGNFLGVEGMTRDITAQRNAKEILELRVQQRTRELSHKVTELEKLQKELQTSEQRFHTLFDSAVDIFLLHDVDGNLIDINNQTCKSLGYSRQELLQLKIDDLDIGPNPVPLSELANDLAKGKTFRTDSVLRRKDGSSFPVEINLGLLEKENQPLFLALLRDMTDRKLAELQILAAKEEAEYASQTKTEFLSRMSHELRTPMNAIIGFSELLESDPDNPLNPSQSDNVTEILNAARHLLELINEILDLARIESGRTLVNMGLLQLDEIIEECITLIQPLAFERGITIINNTNSCSSKNIEADNTRLKQVILNLLSNAIKYNKEYGMITLDCAQVNEHTLRLIIADTGSGLSEQQIATLFQPFERFEAENNGIEGSGIGLVISKHLVELMGGQIGVESQPGQGSRFWIELNILQPIDINTKNTQKISKGIG